MRSIIRRIITQKTKLKSAILILAIICLIVAIFSANQIVDVTYTTKSIADIVPIIYLETGIGSFEYKTKSYIINDNGLKELETHDRSFSRTFPLSALENDYFDGVDILNKYGQLMVFYNTNEGPIYLFEHIGSDLDDDMRYTIIFNEIEATLKYKEGSSLFDINKFGDYFYVFCYDNPDSLTGSFREIKIYKYSQELILMDTFTIDFEDLGLSYNDLVNDSVSIDNNNLYFSVVKNNKFYTVMYRIDENIYDMRLVYYRPICHVIATDKVYAIGTKGSSFVIEEVDDNRQIHYTEAIYPNSAIPLFEIRKQYIYGSDRIIYGNAYDKDGNTILYSYNIQTGKWDNWWTVTTKSNYILADYKFVSHVKENLFDLMPYNLVL